MVAYNESLGVPLLIRQPTTVDGSKGVSNQAPASLIDVAPTLVSLCGLPPVANIQGEDLSDTIRGQGFDVQVRRKMRVDFMTKIDDPLSRQWPNPETGNCNDVSL